VALLGWIQANVPTANQHSLQFLAQEANAQGITLVVASGDTGAADCDTGGKAASKGLAVDFPSSMPEFTSVGGTSFVSPPDSYFSSTNKAGGGSALSYIPEIAWNDSAVQSYPLASGGGISTIYTKPGWQTGIGVPEDGFRDVPDVAIFSEDQTNSDVVGYIICTGGGCSSGAPNLIGGTSASAPVFAGIVALLNNDLVVNNQIQTSGLGNINPHLYSLAGNSSDVFHDVTQGSNIVPCAANTTDCTSGSYGYAAGPGYDQVTELGSVDTFNLLKEWNNVSTNGTTTTLSAPISPVVNNSTVTLTAKVAPGTGNTIPTGSITFYSYAASISTLAVFGTANLDGTGTATLANTNIEGDVTSIYAAYSGSVDFTQSFSQTLQVYTPTSVTLAPSATQSIQGSSVTFTALVSGVYASTVATVSFNNGSTLLGTASLSNGTATLTTSALPIGTDSITASYAGGSINNFEASTSAPVIVTVTPTAPLATTTTLAASPTQATQGDAVTLTATVSPASGTTAPTGTVSFNNGSTLLGTASLSNGTATLITSTLPIGSDSITANYAATAIYTASTSAAVSVTIAAIPVPNFTIAATSSTLTVSGGSAATTTLTVTPVNGFDQALSFTCTGLPVVQLAHSAHP
jgi:subtilase family serine protease